MLQIALKTQAKAAKWQVVNNSTPCRPAPTLQLIKPFATSFRLDVEIPTPGAKEQGFASVFLEGNFVCKTLPERLMKRNLARTSGFGIEDARAQL